MGFDLTIRILEQVVRYRMPKNKRIMLKLSLEERTFTEQLFQD